MNLKSLAEIGQSLSNPTRVQILEWLKDPEKNFPPQPTLGHFDFGVCATFIQKKSGLSQSTISTFLSNMENSGLLISTREGKWTYYKRNEKKIAEYVKSLI